MVDNASHDGSPEMVATEFPGVILIRNQTNVGFGPANNQGAAVATRKLVLYLNSDAYPFPGAIDLLASKFVDDQVVGAGPMLLNLDDSIQDSSAHQLTLWAVLCEQLYLEKLFRGNRLFSPYWNTRDLVAAGGDQRTAQVMGAALMCRIGQENFDERFFLYCEDTDLCRRLSRHGEIVYVSEAKVYHELGSSSSANRWKSVARYNRGKELYFSIHHGKLAMSACWLLDRLGALLRLVVWTVPTILTLFMVKRFRGQALLFLRVLVVNPLGPIRS